jgi:YegS/Rv2252/BmrU family lipid kinase
VRPDLTGFCGGTQTFPDPAAQAAAPKNWSFSSTPAAKPPKRWGVRICVIFNPAARGDKARHLHTYLGRMDGHGALRQTFGPGDARRLAAEAVREGFGTIVAAGGDGTLNEVLNGMGDVPGGFLRSRLGLLPLGTVNVFARELGLPIRVDAAWQVIRKGREKFIDLPCVEFSDQGRILRRYFAQLAGAGLDAQAIQLVNWQHKKRVGPLAYVLAGLRAMARPRSQITFSDGAHSALGELALVGNGRFYGGAFQLFPGAQSSDGRLDITVFPKVDWQTLLRVGPRLLLRRSLPPGLARHFQAASFTLTSQTRAAFEIDGELIGELPVRFSVQRAALRVAVP